MVGGLSRTEADHYHQQGYVVPTFRLSEPEVLQLRESVDRLISENPDTRPEHLVNAHIAHPNAEGVKGAEAILELAKHPGILDQVQSVIGEDIILWGCQLFCKPASDGMEVPWHQDGQYWPIQPLATCTVWVAIDASVVENGCLRVIPGSHRDAEVYGHHTDNRERLTLTQAVDEQHLQQSAPVDVVLQAGQMSLHDVYLIHGSNENKSAHRRAGIAIRYMPATSVFRRDLIAPSSDSGFKVDFSQRPLWLLRGSDQTGQNDFAVGHR